jgi:hypothetical protein
VASKTDKAHSDEWIANFVAAVKGRKVQWKVKNIPRKL